jgi:DNA (cytosine-5)-methyltransferase 1
MSEQLKFIDLFCGIGGFHQALSNLNYKCVYACDIDKDCQKTYEENYNIKPSGDIMDININNIPDFDILCGGFPCQPFSKSGKQEGFKDINRGNLFFKICDIIEIKKPKYIILENVRNIYTHDQGNTWKVIYESLKKLGYNTYDKPEILNVRDFNIPQNRERVVIMCKRIDLGDLQAFPNSIECVYNCSVKDIIKENINENGKYKLVGKLKQVEIIWNKFINILKKNNIEMPKFPIWTDWWDGKGIDTTITKIDKKLTNEQNDEIIKIKTELFYNKYKNWIDKNVDFYNKYKEHLQLWLQDSRKESYWKGAVRKLEWQAGYLQNTDDMNTILWTSRGSGIRVKRLDYTPTMVAMSMIPVYGPESRLLSPREVSRLQSFPETFKMHEKDSITYKQMGNAVNIKMIEQCARFLILNESLY